jgi:hypothetical protein
MYNRRFFCPEGSTISPLLVQCLLDNFFDHITVALYRRTYHLGRETPYECYRSHVTIAAPL